MSKNDGGPAFPITIRHTDMSIETAVGMSIRDYFAAAALQGFCSSPHVTVAWLDERVVKSAWNIADAMLKEREK